MFADPRPVARGRDGTETEFSRESVGDRPRLIDNEEIDPTTTEGVLALGRPE